ncbi:Trp biosynthesis-associated membrane protein [uncultured Leifsonia sp.]|uniref:Trp biosynthesis-associated membrane protein n=1 Tax=uncultured Leifsonia sp. TaxID=340359 RepID=UPI0028D8332C|nr:Trp biosynthesis-associated membrane protein [uncultured Leifsonia sp.]
MSGRRAKYLTLLLLVVGSGLALLAATQTWFTVHLTDVANHVTTVTVAGSAAAPALTALALAGLALTAALAIAGPAFRVVLAVLGILLGASVVFSAVSAVTDPFRAASAAITSATGVAGQASVRKLVDELDTAFWPWFAVAGGIVIVLASAAAIVTLRLWPGPSRKYQTRFQGEDGRDPEDAIAEVSDAEEARAVAEGEAQAEPSALDRDTAIDSWDELSRGDDPTR